MASKFQDLLDEIEEDVEILLEQKGHFIYVSPEVMDRFKRLKAILDELIKDEEEDA